MNKLHRMRFNAPVAGASAALLFLWCSFEPFGGGTEGGNVSGIFINDDGSASAKVTVLLIPSDYNPGAAHQNNPIVTSITTSDGSYSFEHVTQGSYSIEAVHTASGKRTLVPGVAVFGEDIRVPADTLRYPGSIIIYLPASADAATGYVYVPGTTMYTRYTGVTGNVLMSALPAKQLPAICYATLSDPTPTVLRYDVHVVPEDTTVVANTGWKYAQRLCLNTTAAGAGVAQDIMGFPAIVRLTRDNFDFTQSNAGGSDIRFARSDTVRLPYEIERWDAASQRAEIWVKVDTIYGNNGSQTLTMYWGNAAAADSSNSAAVFDTADDCAAVWHLNGNSDDATAAGHDAIADSPVDTAGIIGMGKKFRGSDSIKIAGLLGSPSSISLSAWAQLDSTPPGGGSEILSIGDAALIRMDYALASIGTIGSIHLTGDSTFYNVSSNRFLKRTGWHLITYTIDQVSHTHSLYIDGAVAATRVDSNATIVYSGVGKDTYIGKHGNGKTNFNFFGSIDEVRVYRAPVSADFIKLCYMNQKGDDRLVLFEAQE
jgi:hypothetical protein